ncbi:hypothetical protein PoB_002180900 [Plakobranchus ocellatus]|uniref:Uncharacterized protein n=1 Tax=Plakobranchus ocellatus TaxID=259542 RepID=A0AAV3ZN61_9GAST|nr:hypothetical protein PoB_002180900 [Plakobranchus ocellatus]
MRQVKSPCPAVRLTRQAGYREVSPSPVWSYYGNTRLAGQMVKRPFPDRAEVFVAAWLENPPWNIRSLHCHSRGLKSKLPHGSKHPRSSCSDRTISLVL